MRLHGIGDLAQREPKAVRSGGDESGDGSASVTEGEEKPMETRIRRRRSACTRER